jgi:hypothetical protein
MVSGVATSVTTSARGALASTWARAPLLVHPAAQSNPPCRLTPAPVISTLSR